MIRQVISGVSLAALLKVFISNGGLEEIKTYSFFSNSTLIDGIIFNLITMAVFAELYWLLDKNSKEGEEHFGFGGPVDAYYFSAITSSSVGYGDYSPKTNVSKILNMVHILTMFFVILPIVLEALKPGN